MPTIRTENGLFETEDLPNNIEPIFCGQYGCRVGWADTAISDTGVQYCDDCIPDVIEEMKNA